MAQFGEWVGIDGRASARASDARRVSRRVSTVGHVADWYGDLRLRGARVRGADEACAASCSCAGSGKQSGPEDVSPPDTKTKDRTANGSDSSGGSGDGAQEAETPRDESKAQGAIPTEVHVPDRPKWERLAEIASEGYSPPDLDEPDTIWPEDFSVDMAPPDPGDWGADCLTDAQITAAQTVCVPPLGITITVAQFEAMPQSGSVSIDGATAEELELIRTAWAVLEHNMDLVAFAACYATGGDTSIHCLRNRISGLVWGFIPSKVTIRLEDHPYCAPSPFRAGWSVDGGWIRICRPYQFTKSYLEAWRGDQYNRMCAALDLSATLLHEITHICLRAHGDSSGECYVSYLLENTFRWALYKRYSDAHKSDGCDCFYDVEEGRRYAPDHVPELVRSDLFMSDETWWLYGCQP